MTVKDLLENPGFDCNCCVNIYDASDGKQFGDGAPLIFSNYGGTNQSIPFEDIAEKEICYITLENSAIAVEVK